MTTLVHQKRIITEIQESGKNLDFLIKHIKTFTKSINRRSWIIKPNENISSDRSLNKYKFPCILRKIEYKGKKIHLKENLYLYYEHEDNLYSVRNNYLDLVSYGKDYEDAVKNFEEDFIYLNERIVLTKKKLSPKALELKDKILNVIHSYCYKINP